MIAQQRREELKRATRPQKWGTVTFRCEEWEGRERNECSSLIKKHLFNRRLRAIITFPVRRFETARGYPDPVRTDPGNAGDALEASLGTL